MKICIVSHFAFGMLKGSQHDGHIGGVERQVTAIGRWLTKHTTHEVTLITWDEGQENNIVIDGVRVVKLCKQHAGLPYLRFFFPKWYSLNRALESVNADLYYQNSGDCITGQVAMWCKRRRKKFIFSVASNLDVDKKLPDLPNFREKILYRYGIKNATQVIVQTNYQRLELLKNFGIDSKVFPMVCSFSPPYPPILKKSLPEFPRILWVGRIVPSKRLELLLLLASEFTNWIFDIAGPFDPNNAYAKDLASKTKEIKNINMHGKISPESMPLLYMNADLLCCTSTIEGFPNTFIESWSHGVPVISTFDPDCIINANKLGISVKTIEEIICAFNLLKSNPKLYETISHNSILYYINNYSISSVMPLYEKLFIEVNNIDQD